MPDPVLIINPPKELELCEKMVAMVRGYLERVSNILVETTLDRPDYLQYRGEARALQKIVDELQSMLDSYIHR